MAEPKSAMSAAPEIGESYAGLSIQGQVDRRKAEKTQRLVVQALLVVATIAVGVLVLVSGEGLDISEAVYVVIYIVTTIGYGDIAIEGYGVKVFLAFYVLWVLVLVAFFLNRIIQSALDAQEDRARQRLRTFEAQVLRRITPDSNVQGDSVKKKFGRFNRLAVTMAIFLAHLLFGTIFYALLERCTCSYGRLSLEKESCTPETACENGWSISLMESFYMSVVTLTTVGFGDFSPKTLAGRVVGMFWFLSGVLSTAGFLEAMQLVFFEVSEESRLDDVDLVNDKLFAETDDDKDGTLSENDFLHYCIVQHHLIDPEIVKSIKDLYRKIADKPGAITIRDIQKYKLRRERRRAVAERVVKHTGCVVM